jgi:hypothetical protein
MRNIISSSIALALVCVASPALAGDAVSGLNGKIEGLYGTIYSDRVRAVAGSFTMPFLKQFGLQIDGLIGEIKTTDPDDFSGFGGHLFWRDSEKGLFGITASWADTLKIDITRVGIEWEYYIHQFTIYGRIGHQSNDIDDAGYGSINLNYYPIDDLRLSIGGSIADSDNRYGIDAEYQTPASGLSLFANVAGGDNNYEHIYGGFRYYFGKEKSLIQKHREDGSSNNLMRTISEAYTR